MANIGSFKKSGAEFQGEIVTLSVQARGVRIIPETNRANENAPSYRVFVGRAEIGAAWTKRSTEGRDYLSLKLDDPSFTAPIYANLFDDEDGDGYSLVWSRGRKASGERLNVQMPWFEPRLGRLPKKRTIWGPREVVRGLNHAVRGAYFLSADFRLCAKFTKNKLGLSRPRPL
ncbi:hypothetical protein LMG27198_50420 [Methylocystis echinoides]|uniref:DUF736 domain-containing protein n=2 Tax=Methylocystis echinoides TaxID=29468 RepID=A0A9W6LUQ5_9HYPH|nr:hypothetical protein LMG27198_50420 [Methylocystis echinoides]